MKKGDKRGQFFIKKNRKGLSSVITTLIIILLSLVAIGIVWVVISNIISSGSEDIGIEKFTIDVNFLRASINGNDITLTVKRAVGVGNMSGIKFIISDGLNSEDFTEKKNLAELQEKTFIVTLKSLNPENVKTASVAPIYISASRKETLGSVTDTYNFGEGTSGGGGPICGNDICESGETVTSCSADCTSDDGDDGGGGPICGNDICESGETVTSCSADCACVPACVGDDTCISGICVPPGCTEPRTDEEVCTDAGAICGNVLNTCGEFIDCDVAMGGCAAIEQCVNNLCVPLTVILGTVYSVWPEGVGVYFDSADLPIDNLAFVYYAKFLPPSQESECLLIEDYEVPVAPQTRVIIRLLATQTSVAPGDSVELWPTYESCMA